MGRGKGVRAMTPADFMPEFGKAPITQAELQIKLDNRLSILEAGASARAKK